MIVRMAQRMCRLALLALACVASSQEQASEDNVLIPVLVVDRKQAPVVGLNAGDFRVLENGVERTIAHVSSNDPLSVAIVLDTSASRRDRLAQGKQVIDDFLRAMNSEDEFLVLGLNDRPGAVASFTSDAALTSRVILATKAGGPTPLFDSIFTAAEHLSVREHSRRKVILVDSDGEDNVSRHTFVQLKAMAGRPDVLVYAIGPPGFPDSEGELNPLMELARLTGGHYFVDGTSGVGSKIAQILRSQYILAYKSPRPAKAGKYRNVKIVARPAGRDSNLKVISRPGYYAP
jgi:Ca-activated chloride channel family protein